MKKIVLIGGPCAGKTTMLPILEEYYTERGYNVIIVPEAATEVFKEGGSNVGDAFGFQRQIIEKQLRLETEAIAKATDNTIIFFDRGVLDGKAYLQECEWKQLEEAFELNPLDRYDGVVHLTSVAVDRPELYNRYCRNNKHRKERIEASRKLDSKTLSAWKEVFDVKVIGNSGDWNKKVSAVTDAIDSLLY